jgi:uncharacterized protein with HEPN domain
MPRPSRCESRSGLPPRHIELIEVIRRHQPGSEAEFAGDEVLPTATVHWVQTIGEAADAVSDGSRHHHPEVPWRQVIDLRTLPAHGYRHVGPSIVWQVVVRDLPVLQAQMRRVLEQPPDGD